MSKANNRDILSKYNAFQSSQPREMFNCPVNIGTFIALINLGYE